MKPWLTSRWRPLGAGAFVLLCCTGLVLLGATPKAEQASERDSFELGAGAERPAPGMGDVVGDLAQGGPDWSDLFDANGAPRDDYDANGIAGPNGVPDYVELYAGRGVVFIADDISVGTRIDRTARAANGARVAAGIVPSAEDLGNAYGFFTTDDAGRQVVYLGLERLAAVAGSVEFELNQQPFDVAADGRIVGQRTDGDLAVRIDFDADGIAAVEVSRWDAGSAEFVHLTGLDAEGCDAADTLCAFSNAEFISAGDWPNYDASGTRSDGLVAGTFAEVGIASGQLAGATTGFSAVQVSTGSDVAVASVRAFDCTTDQQGPDDEPGQKDLNELCLGEAADYPAACTGDFAVTWNWDDTAWQGNNTGDACGLFDTDGDGFANFALCVTVGMDPAVQLGVSPRLYTCGDDRPDRCTQPTVEQFGFTSACVVATDDDPFAGIHTGQCADGSSGPDCFLRDTQATCCVELDDISVVDAQLIDVCSFPSEQPNSDPSDCVVAPTGQDPCQGVDCSHLDDQCQVGVCNSSTGLCEPQPANTGSACDDGDACTTGEVCQPDGTCGGGGAVNCDNGLFCDGEEFCDPTLGCQDGPDPVCDDGVACTVDTCNEATDSCDYTPDDTVCDNGLFCDGEEFCDPTLGCQDGPDPVCDDGISCTLDSCNETTDSCDYMPNDAACDDSDPCTVDSCDPTSGCVYVDLPDSDNDGFCDDIDICPGYDDSIDSDGDGIPDGCDVCDPRTQGYWHRQCLGVDRDHEDGGDGIEPGRNDNEGGPPRPIELEFHEECTDNACEISGIYCDDDSDCAKLAKYECADAQLGNLLSTYGEANTCDGLDAEPASDECQRAIKQLTALVLNECAGLVTDGCELDLSLSEDGCSESSATTISGLISDLDAAISSGDPDTCKAAAQCAAAVNEGTAVLNTAPSGSALRQGLSRGATSTRPMTGVRGTDARQLDRGTPIERNAPSSSTGSSSRTPARPSRDAAAPTAEVTDQEALTALAMEPGLDARVRIAAELIRGGIDASMHALLADYLREARVEAEAQDRSGLVRRIDGLLGQIGASAE